MYNIITIIMQKNNKRIRIILKNLRTIEALDKIVKATREYD